MGNSVTLTLQTPTLTINDSSISRAEVIEEDGKHQMAIVDVRYAISRVGHPAISGLAEKTPVLLVFGGVGLNLRKMYGYVHHAEDLPTVDREAGVHTVQYVIIGSSLPMNTQHRRSWMNLSRTAVVREIIDHYNLRLVIETNHEVVPSIVQSDESDFQLLNRLADELGYRFFISGSTAWFIGRHTQVLGPSKNELLTFRLDKTLGNSDSIKSLNTVRGRAVPGQGRPANRTINGYDIRGGRVFTVKDKSVDDDVNLYVPTMVSSVAQARARLEAESARNSQWSTTTVSVFGDVKVHPGQCVNLTGRAVTADTQGIWVVSSVTHSMTPGSNKYTSTFKATKGADLFTRSVNMLNFGEDVPCTLDNGSWRASSIGVFDVIKPETVSS